jgi:hypothetical protein
MKKYFIISFLVVVIFGLFFWREKNSNAPVSVNKQVQPESIVGNVPISEPAITSPVQNFSGLQFPLNRVKERVTKKPFGIFINQKTSPIQPERFSGYHTGTDFEIFPEELNSEVIVSAICDGKLVSKKTASGYGGVAVQSCLLDNQPITIVYGHLKLSSIAKNIGENFSAGEEIGELGKAYSQETDGERKHLHLGIHKGLAINILGYVQNKNALSDWVDPCFYLCE